MWIPRSHKSFDVRFGSGVLVPFFFLQKRYLHCLKNCGIIVGENPIKKLTILFLLTECRSALKSSPQLKKNLHQQIATNILKLEKFIENSLKRVKVIFQKIIFNLKYHQFCRKECSVLNQLAGSEKINW